MLETNLAGFIRREFDIMKRHRDSANGWASRLMEALRTFNGKYDATKLAEIQKFGGSQVYARLTAQKCRGASALLRDVYLGADRPWDIEPPADPDVPASIMEAIKQLVSVEAMTLAQAGQPVDPEKLKQRALDLMGAARDAAKKQARQKTQWASDKIEEILQEGGFYTALAEIITDIPLFPLCVMKGPIVRVEPSVSWENGKPTTTNKPKLFWYRVSPFDFWMTPGVSNAANAAIVERIQLTRTDLNDLLDLPGYNHDAIRQVLDEYGRGGLFDVLDSNDSERALEESRENPHLNQSNLISCLEYHGPVQGRMLLEYGMDASLVPDEMRDYMVQAWLIGRYVIKVQISPSPRKRHPYYVTSFEKVPGTPVGNGLPDILGDVQDVANATLRSLVNNLSISSGPQVTVNDDRLAPGEDGDEIFPWKRWHVTESALGTSQSVKPIEFFQPTSNAAELINVYNHFSGLADELSAIPKYLSGSNPGGGAGRTASGLAMLMGNASKVLQTVAANIDRDVLEPLLNSLYDMIMLTDATGLLSGEETIRVKGVTVAIQRETQRSRQIEFLQATANPIDAPILGTRGRAAVLRAVSQQIGLEGQKLVPSDMEIEEREKQQAMMAQQQAMMAQQQGVTPGGNSAAQAQGGQRPPPGNKDMGPRTNLQQRAPQVNGGVG